MLTLGLDPLAELRCRSHGGVWLERSELCDYTGECAEQGMDWRGEAHPNGTPICVARSASPPSGPPRLAAPTPSRAGLTVIGVLTVAVALYYLVR